MIPPRSRLTALLFAFGVLVVVAAGLSILDLFLPRPFDGVVLESDSPGAVWVRSVVPGSGAAEAGLRPGDRIAGIDRVLLRSTAHADEILAARRAGEVVPYLVARDGTLREVSVRLGYRAFIDFSYLFACLLGFGFFAIGKFVLRRQPGLRSAQVFFILTVLFLAFLVCRLRPASYTWMDSFALGLGMIALLLLPASFLHFFLIFPEPVPLRPLPGAPDFRRRRRLWTGALLAIYLLPLAVLAGTVLRARLTETPLALLSGAPKANWWLLAIYLAAGLAALAWNIRRLTDPRLRSGGFLVLLGAIFGLAPFLVAAVAFPPALHTDPYRFFVLAALALVPLTFAVAIVRYQLLDIRVILRKSLFYTFLTLVLSAFYGFALAAFNALAQGSEVARTSYFPLQFALVVVLLLEPLRRWSLRWVNRFVYPERPRLEREIAEMELALGARVDLPAVVRELVERLPRVLDLRFAGLYLLRDGALHREAGPALLPELLPFHPELHRHLAAKGRPLRCAELGGREGESVKGAGSACQLLASAGVELIGDLTSPRRQLGLVVFAASEQLSIEEADLALLGRLLRQAALALETSLLLEERARQAELERELEIASTVQAGLLPERLRLPRGWAVAAACRPARHVGGDFYAELPGPRQAESAVVYGDVAGKGVPGALVMMAAHEALQTLALSHRDPGVLFDLANQRLYRSGSRRGFVAVGYLAPGAHGEVDYLVAGQPPLLWRRGRGEVEELPLGEHRLPLGALLDGGYRASHAAIAPGELLLGYSDGALDALSPEGEPFGFARLAAALANAPAEPEAAVAHLLSAIAAHSGGAEPYDDITLVVLAREPEA
ncbi:MAG TPA: SpoIIE family protein phosphatase [Thermoanaerobaculia bacterium]|nr:SpoIIE family protein phosphatase [Thermoanaerobaculia bacterium]